MNSLNYILKKLYTFLNSKKVHILLLCILTLGGILRFYHLATKSLWYDEILTTSAAVKNTVYVLKGKYTVHPPLHYLITHFFLIIKQNDYFARLPSAIFGFLCLWMVYKCGKILFGYKEGLIAAFLMAVIPAHIAYSQEARMYTQMIFLSMVTLFFTLKILENKSFKYFLLFSIATVLNLYTHYSAFMVLGIELPFIIFSLCWNGRKWRHLGYFSVSLLMLFILYLPQIYKLSKLSAEYIGGGTSFINRAIVNVFNLNAFFDFYTHVKLLLGTIVFFITIAIIGSLKDRLKEILLLMWWIVAPFIFISVVKIKHFYTYRYLLFISPVLIILWARGVLLTSEYITKILDKALITKLASWYANGN